MKRFIKLYFCLSLICGFGSYVNAQNCEVSLMIYIPEQPEDIPMAAETYLVNQMNKVATANGLAASEGYSQFLITPRFTVLGKSILPGPPRSFVYEFDISLFIGDYLGQKVFSSTSINVKGIGSNETKAYLDAIKRINPSSRELQAFIAEGKTKIIAYYDANYQNIIKKAQSLAVQKQFEEAMFNLTTIPECSRGYSEALKATSIVYKQYVDDLCNKNLSRAKAVWVSQQDYYGASEAAEYLSEIYPEASCYREAMSLYREIKAKIREEWAFEMKQYDDDVALDKQRVNAWKEVGVAYGNNQKQEVNNVYWGR
jgi:hypothetical protein